MFGAGYQSPSAAKVVLHVGEHQVGGELAVGREALVHVLRRVLVVGVFHAHGDGEARLGGVCVGAYGLRREGISGYFAAKLKVGRAVHLLEAGVARYVVEELVLECLLERGIHEGGAYREFGDVDCLVDVVVDGGAVHAPAEGA